VTATAWVLSAVTAVAAVANWWSRWHDHRATELWSKPLTIVALTGVALTIDPANPTMRWWFVGALVLSLAGDVLLLGDRRWFIAGLASFLVAHLAYSAGFLVSPERRWWAAALAAVAAAVLADSFGRAIVAGAAARALSLSVPVAAYLVVISAMLVMSALAGNAVAMVGAALFVGSDTMLGWRQFVREQRWMPVAIMVTYHLAQACLVVSLLW
jgi:uncharacterized membrane protein YhhN